MFSEVLAQNFQTGITIAVIGMLVVLAFLVLMIAVMNVANCIIQVLNKYFPEEIKEPQNKKKQKKASNNDDEIAVAIAVALAKESRG